MEIKKLFDDKKVVFSFEIFPPKVTSKVEVIYETLATFSYLKPDFVSVTFGAGGSASDNKTTELSSLVKNKYGIETVAHLTCVNSKVSDIDCILENLKHNGILNILALRGDIIDKQNLGEFKYASELISHIKQKGNFSVSAACYPEGHIESTSLEQDIINLKEKVDSGADHLISQLFFDNNVFYKFLDETSKKGINVPIQAGIMPVTNKKQIERIASISGAKIPPKFLKILDKYENDKEALRDAGIYYAVEQIIDLISSGVKGIHLYTMNSPYVARKVTESIEHILSSINNKNIR
ncbi:5,10-methylenetetrahydrofolate reductase (NAD(P)) [Clostridium cavendishii DSM 21758]|uniref:Methylenetetrahydrofolate reductase n=1 Tax=Clostridium cavendishii DSM 21758 TaxID=1121302 RepID=A0A1M6ENX2_9CLOT|nr:methylenetetrahydrofolate reductase [NAD(P)H] [Clostridium cavendishii]SHI87126.1 5,10-methylenetetrahydrofolate reductase (NAD(P)) [Clostridium cavendishii DSM 21758]